MLQHVILTRFNLATPGREADIRNRPGWLTDRFELFEKYCLPSISAQQEQNFVWIIYFDKDTPQTFKDRAEELRKIFPFVPYYTGLFRKEGWPRSVREVLAEQGKEPEWLISTRLDNDDSLSNDYTARIRAAVHSQPLAPRAMNITHGCILSGR